MSCTIEPILEEIKKNVSEGKYIQLRDLNECKELVPEVQKILSEYRGSLEPYKGVVRRCFHETEEWLWDVVYYVLHILNKDEALREISWYVYRALNDRLYAFRQVLVGLCEWNRYVTLSVVRSAACELVKDVKVEGQKLFENLPFKKLGEISEMGLVPKGFREVGNKEVFLVYFPALYGGKLVSACSAEGEKEISYVHEYFEDCEHRRLIKKF